MRSLISDVAGSALGGFRRWGVQMFADAMEHNLRNIEELIEPAEGARLLDIGCDDGERTLRYAERIGTSDVAGVEIVPERAAQAMARGIEVARADLEEGLPYEDGSIDIAVSNQVIEHLRDTDLFASEISRVLRPGGYTVVSTENLAAWHNIAALVAGWQPFSLTNVTNKGLGLGNRLALLRGEETGLETWQHVRVFAYSGLTELFELHGMTVERVLGAGYYPLPTAAARLDPRHAAFLALRARKR